MTPAARAQRAAAIGARIAQLDALGGAWRPPKGRGASPIRAMFPELEAGRMARRMANWTPSRSHVNTLIAASGKTVLARSRYLTRNNVYASSAVECFAANVIGTGIVPEWGQETPFKGGRKNAIETAWNGWCDEADIEGITDLYGLQKRCARELFIGGEAFIVRRPRFMGDMVSGVPLQLQLLPSEQLPTERNFIAGNGNRVRQGIEFDLAGRRVAYHFWKVHPGDITQAMEFGLITRTPAEDVIHLHDPVESGQLRGLPKMTPAIVQLWEVDGYCDAERARKKTAALFSVFIELQDTGDTFLGNIAREQGAKREEGSVTQNSGGVTIDLAPASVHSLAQGEKVSVAAPADVGPNYEAFMYRELTAFCAAVDLPYSAITADVSKANYSSQRAALLEMRRRLESLQYHVVIFQFCRRVSQWFLDAANIAGALKLPGYAADPQRYAVSLWTPPRWDWIDPLKDRQAEILAVASGFKSRSSVIRAEGNDPVAVDEAIAADAQRAKDLGIEFAGAPPLKQLLSEPPPSDPEELHK